jgi:IS1 family transposase
VRPVAGIEAGQPALPLQEVQIDEVYAFVHCLQQNTEPENPIHGDQYTFLAVDRPSKLIAHWFVGKRTKENAVEFLRGLRRCINGRIQLSSDAWQAYHSYLGAVFQVFRESIDYGTEMKYFARTPGLGPDRRENPVVLQWIKREAKIGHPDPYRITTAHVERTNLSVRLFNRRFTRKTLGYSKKLANLKRRRRAVGRALQLLPRPFCAPHDASNGRRAYRSRLDGGGVVVRRVLNQS